MTKMLEKLFLPQGLLFIALLIGIFTLLRFKNTKFVIKLWGLSLCTIILLSVPYVGESLIYTLESQHPPKESSLIEPRNLLIVAGGGVKVPFGNRSRAELGGSGDRLAYAVELYKMQTVKNILVTAGNVDRRAVNTFSEARFTKDMLVSWGVASGDIQIETQGKTTFQNAVRIKAMLVTNGERLDEASFLLSSAYHLPRAIATFCSAGVKVVPIGANRLTYGKPIFDGTKIFPTVGALWMSTTAIREHIGFFYYRLKGHIKTTPSKC